jgi:HEAT repeat protein
VLLGVLVAGALGACSGEAPAPRPQTEREYREQREREIMDSGPSWAQRLAAAPGEDDIDRAISLLRTADDYDYNAVDFLANELSLASDRRVVKALIEVVAQASFPARNRAATALGTYGETEARNAILMRLKRDPHFAGPLIVALGQLGDERVVRELEYLASHSDDPLVIQNAGIAKRLIEKRLEQVTLR